MVDIFRDGEKAGQYLVGIALIAASYEAAAPDTSSPKTGASFDAKDNLKPGSGEKG
ncbi:MAG: hypothetical protein JWR19_167 [Pedosphaera sp.]|nr:hypothetical protein [Pedosphaera sp.]